MSSVDLNIIQRGAASDFNWTAGPGRITAADLGNIGEQRTDNGGALNALPTPFARFYIFKEAFRRVLEERNNPAKQAGSAYERLVSISIYPSEFEKTPKRSIKRYLYDVKRLGIK